MTSNATDRHLDACATISHCPARCARIAKASRGHCASALYRSHRHKFHYYSHYRCVVEPRGPFAAMATGRKRLICSRLAPPQRPEHPADKDNGGRIVDALACVATVAPPGGSVVQRRPLCVLSAFRAPPDVSAAERRAGCGYTAVAPDVHVRNEVQRGWIETEVNFSQRKY